MNRTFEGFLLAAGALAVIFVLGLGLLRLAAWGEPYQHPCAEDEYVRVDGACVHVDRL